MKAGIVGLPGTGRRTLFRLLTRTAGVEPHRTAQIGVLKVPDPRLEEVARIQRSRKITPATIELVLIPGLVKGGSSESLDLPALRNVDVLVHVVRAFEDPSFPHPDGSVDPKRDVEVVDLELMLADLGVVEKRIERLRADAKKGKKPDPAEVALLDRAREALAEGRPVRVVLSPQERVKLRGYALLTAKPCLLVVNTGEEGIRNQRSEELGLAKWSEIPGTRLCRVSARIEAEIAELAPADAAAFRKDLGVEEGAIERIVRAAFDVMGMVTFYTAEEKEARAWIIPRGSTALGAAGAVHSDMERGFIRAEVVPTEVLAREGSWSACREKGLLRVEGKTYEVADGDVIYFRFQAS